jgi:glucose-6-phosphate isomerase, archaeal
MTDLAPFTTLLDLDTGELTRDSDTVVARRLADLTGLFLHETDTDPERLVYRVFPVEVPPTNANLLHSITVLEPGRVGDEYFMTKGHFHAVRDRAEIYLGLSGTGRLVMATEDGRSVVEPMHRGTLNYVSGGWAHRSVNVGDGPLVFLAVYIGDAGYDYATIEREGFPVRVVEGSDGPVVEPNPRYRANAS